MYPSADKVYGHVPSSNPTFHLDSSGNTVMGDPKWAVKDGPGQKAIDHLLTIPGVQEKLGLSYNNICALLQKVDSVPDCADPIKAIKTLFADPAFENDHVYGPKKVYTDSSKSSRIFSEMCTRKWWHAIQYLLPEGATIAPIILATDKTQLTQFSGGKSVYPVYLTIGNLPKAIQ
ncbi:hypothetical protein CPB84DRAFT_1742860 [Gymnopilus junonius]|uniref:Uncharacterized protein n=1 Tax=Gymnopilus junonius TaxID=109634 RepID=A0A9P5TSW9_GYMJU|nr:hypothetical protein CPB84DRAFT_1742860 [Gymnopilus junonius]